MNNEKWELFKRAARGGDFDAPPVALIVDSPWIPGYLSLSTLDYLTVPEVWLDANLRVEREFSEVIFLPGFWAETGMCAEPSAFGCKISLYRDKTPVAHPMISGIEELDRLAVPNPLTDGFMPMILNLYRRLEPRVNDAGHVIKMVAARGPLTVATHLMGVSNFLLGMKLEPAATHRLLRLTVTLVRQWLDAQAAALKEVEAIMVLDDIAGFMSPKDYLEFAHPYLKEVFDAFPNAVRVFHDDTDNVVPFKHLRDLGIHVFNFTHLQPIAKVRELVGPDLCLMGNVPPLDVLTNGTPELVAQSARECVTSHLGKRGLILSAGGGTSPGTPGANIRALVEAAKTL
ncbi:MAG: uroporphyrinogen decarboxylase family protein [Verrucomicrobia bacterium]|nr:uroporphyrinogen decarboxylase family protein [Verrucomicrobiota bacterium]